MATKSTRDRAPPASITKLIEGMAHRHSSWQIFSDFCEMAAISIGNAVDLVHREKREERYMQIVGKYQPDEVKKFPEMMARVIESLEEGFSDVLGKCFHELELHNKWTGQFFTPYPVCQMMAQMTVGDDHRAIIEERGFIRASEPACGSGAMVIALAEAMKNSGINYQRHLHVTAVDVDLKCVHMAYLQFSLLHIPATIIHGNAITLEEWDTWNTPAHIMGGWDWKLRTARPAEVQSVPEPDRPPAEAVIPPTTEPSQLTLF